MRLTQTTAFNHGAQWSPNGTKVVFLSDRDGHENIYLLESEERARGKIAEARRFTTKQLTHFTDAAGGVTFTPDGKTISFVQKGRLWTMNPDGSDQKTIVAQPTVIDYEWSPDSKWVVYSRMDGSFASELYVIPATGATAENPARNITRYATFNAGVTWSLDGRKLAFRSNRRGNPDGLVVLSLLKPVGPGVAEKPPALTPTVDFDWDDIHLRAKSITTMAVSGSRDFAGRQEGRLSCYQPGERRPVGRQRRRQPVDPHDGRQPSPFADHVVEKAHWRVGLSRHYLFPRRQRRLPDDEAEHRTETGQQPSHHQCHPGQDDHSRRGRVHRNVRPGLATSWRRTSTM